MCGALLVVGCNQQPTQPHVGFLVLTKMQPTACHIGCLVATKTNGVHVGLLVIYWLLVLVYWFFIGCRIGCLVATQNNILHWFIGFLVVTNEPNKNILCRCFGFWLEPKNQQASNPASNKKAIKTKKQNIKAKQGIHKSLFF